MISVFIRMLMLNKTRSGLLLFLLSSNFSARVSHFHSDLLSTLNNLSSFLDHENSTLELTLWAISAQKVLLFMSKTSRSLALWTTNFLRPFGKKNLVVLSEPYPILGIFLFPLKRRRILLSIPWVRNSSTSGSSPAFCESTSIKIWLEASELKGSFLDDSLLEQRCWFDHKNIDINLLIFQNLNKEVMHLAI